MLDNLENEIRKAVNAEEDAKAIYLLKELIAENEQKLGDEHPETIAAYRNLAELYILLQRYEEAYSLFLKVMTLEEKKLGKQHPEMAIHYNNVAIALKRLFRYDEAIAYYQKSIAILEFFFGKDHLETAVAYDNLGNLYHRQKDYDRALDLHLQALLIYTKKSPDNYLAISAVYFHIAHDYTGICQYEIALINFQLSLVMLGNKPARRDFNQNTILESYLDVLYGVRELIPKEIGEEHYYFIEPYLANYTPSKTP